MYKFIILSISILLQACTSPAEKINYYLLHTASNDTVKKINPQAPRIVLDKIQLAEYLRQDSLVLQLSEHELFYSPKDIWAENLQTAISKALLFDLNQQSNYYQYVNYTSARHDSVSYALVLQIEHFLATDKSEVVTAGKYSLENQETGEQLLSEAFYLHQGLQKDGYPHAVQQLRTLVFALSDKISRSSDSLQKQH
ncbi:MAG: putative lipoprotein YmbA [Paraglaciecola sp.]|jgi:uncharacterized lipoprotein YmbA